MLTEFITFTRREFFSLFDLSSFEGLNKFVDIFTFTVTRMYVDFDMKKNNVIVEVFVHQV